MKRKGGYWLVITAVTFCSLALGMPAQVQAESSEPVKVAILDTGIDLDHPDLQVAGDVTFISGTTSGDDDHGHGTLVAGIVDVRHRLRDSAEDLSAPGWDTQYGCGIVNADLAINFTEPPDQSAPTTTISLIGTPGNDPWYLSDVEVVISAADNDGGSGVAETQYSLDGGQTWDTYTSPLNFTEEGEDYQVMARSWDNAGNDEGPPAFDIFKIDKTPPVTTMTATATEFKKGKKGEMAGVSYDGFAVDELSGLDFPYVIEMIDEYGVYDQDLGVKFSGSVIFETWGEGKDKDGRTYIIRLTTRDKAGNEAHADAIVTILHPSTH